MLPIHIKPEKPPSDQLLMQAERAIDWLALQPAMQAISMRVRTTLRIPVYKMLLLQHWYGLTDRELEDACQDRISFRRFLGVPLEGEVAEATVLEAFRQGLADATGELTDFFRAVEAQLRRAGISMSGRVPPVLEEAASPAAVVAPSTGPQGFAEKTMFFDPGELAGLVEAAAAKSSGRIAGPVTLERLAKSAPPADGLDAPPSSVVVEVHWLWGVATVIKGTLRIGRDFGFCTIAKDLQGYRHISRRHIELSLFGDGVWVRDLGSSNGTWVDDEQVPKGQAHLVDADARVRLGPNFVMLLRFRPV